MIQVATRMGESCLFPLCCPGALLAMRAKLRGEQNIQVIVKAMLPETICNFQLTLHRKFPTFVRNYVCTSVFEKLGGNFVTNFVDDVVTLANSIIVSVQNLVFENKLSF